ncbi:MAG TPA: D-Ala-D-Ala carboxypeptidase family metallohydrolase [Hyphomicrobiaceae bacterium]|nr:D-Ala-D-Ala carboxypeptidase family metallohydrolase [Hyphomicrobiaceae bacterium]
MHKWRLRAALALSLGLITTAANSHSYDFNHNTWRADDGDGQAGRPRRQRVAYVDRTDGEEAEVPHRRSLAREHGGHHRHHGTGASTSRGCLTAAARALLERIETKFGKMQIISTCRPGAVIAGTGRRSKHASGEAIDFNAGSRKAAVVGWLIANHKSGGTMTYRGMSHIHVDVGHHFVSLNSGGGR